MSEPTYWDPASLLIDDPSCTGSKRHIAVVVLNQPIRNVTVFLNVCSRAHTIIAVDGGANRIKDLYLNESRLRTCMPHAIVGDLDSLRDDVRSYFAERGVPVKEHVDTESTDFGKVMQYVREHADTDTSLDIAAFGGLGGRADHAFAQLNDLYRASIGQEGLIFLFTAESILFLLETGKNTIRTPQTPRTFGESVGIIPLGRPAIINTQGLEWDVKDYETHFGSKVSTSNHIRSDTVEIETTERVLFTMEFALKPHP